MALITRQPSLSRGNRSLFFHNAYQYVCMHARMHARNETNKRNVRASLQAGLNTHTVFASTGNSQSVGKMCVHIRARIRLHMHLCERMQIDTDEDEGTHAQMNFTHTIPYAHAQTFGDT